MKLTMKLAGFALLPVLLGGCSPGVSNKTVDYEKATQMPGYGYITMNFRDSNEVPGGRDYVKDKASYSIMYVKEGAVLFVAIENVPFSDKQFDAYIPYYKGYKFRDVSRLFFLPPRKNSGNEYPQSHFVHVYSVPAIGKTWCPETEFKNGQRFDAEAGCPNDWRTKNGAHGLKKEFGDIWITPHFTPENAITFTNREAPVRASVGS